MAAAAAVSSTGTCTTEEEEQVVWLRLGEAEAGAVSKASRMRRQDLRVSRIVWYCREAGPKVSRAFERLVIIY
jgi:hypothetical protein